MRTGERSNRVGEYLKGLLTGEHPEGTALCGCCFETFMVQDDDGGICPLCGGEYEDDDQGAGGEGVGAVRVEDTPEGYGVVSSAGYSYCRECVDLLEVPGVVIRGEPHCRDECDSCGRTLEDVAVERAKRHGCCADKVCDHSTCMALPEGKSCAGCEHLRRCVSMFGAQPSDTSCQFFPRRFRHVEDER